MNALNVLDLKVDWPVRSREGWDLFECSDRYHAPIEIERIDTPDEEDSHHFESDEDAWIHVIGRAQTGSGVHVRALAILAMDSCEELIGIFNALYHGTYRTFLPVDPHLHSKNGIG